MKYRYRCRLCEFRGPLVETRQEAEGLGDKHRHTFEHWIGMVHLEGVQSLSLAEVRNE